MQLDAAPIRREPAFCFFVEAMAGAIVDNEKDLSTPTVNERLEELQERAAVEFRRKLVGEARPFFDRQSAIDVAGLPHSVRVDSRLNTDGRPSPVEASIEPEAGFVLEGYDAAAGRCFFLMAGNVVRSQTCCAWRSARASRLRGRCTEKPSW